ncbi:hypothetical protein ANFP_14420 [Acidithiobacillus ferrooxidans]|nr:hypothetical protein ANFP_14420 [Acidithiobacillus ferrooxidans]
MDAKATFGISSLLSLTPRRFPGTWCIPPIAGPIGLDAPMMCNKLIGEIEQNLPTAAITDPRAGETAVMVV